MSTKAPLGQARTNTTATRIAHKLATILAMALMVATVTAASAAAAHAPQTAAQPASIDPGASDEAASWWIWILAGAGVIVIIGGVVLGVLMSRDPPTPTPHSEATATTEAAEHAGTWHTDDAWIDDEPDYEPAATEAQFEIQCPGCGSAFWTAGSRPLHVTCPHCARSGLLR